MRPIWRIKLVNVDTSSPLYRNKCKYHEWHSETDLRERFSNIMVMSNREMACRRNNATPQQRRFPRLASSDKEKTNHDTPPLLIRSGKNHVILTEA